MRLLCVLGLALLSCAPLPGPRPRPVGLYARPCTFGTPHPGLPACVDVKRDNESKTTIEVQEPDDMQQDTLDPPYGPDSCWPTCDD